jgi:exonuclease SbcD
MKIAHVADTHIEERSDTASLEDQVRLLKWIGEDAASAGARVLLHAGDVFDSMSTPTERRSAIEVFTSWAEHMPVIVVRGNHDRLLDLHVLARIRSRNPILVYEEPGVHTIAGVTVACLPWPRKSALAAAMGATSALDLNTTAAQAMRAVLAGLSAQLRTVHGPRVLLGHVELGTALTDSGQPLAGRCDIELGESDLLEVGADYIALGHIHRHQIIRERICYPGAPRQTTFGEEGPKGYCLVEINAGEAPTIEHRRSPHRELITIVGEWRDGAMVWTGRPDIVPTDAFVRLKYAVPESDRVQAAAAAAELAAALPVPVKVAAEV